VKRRNRDKLSLDVAIRRALTGRRSLKYVNIRTEIFTFRNHRRIDSGRSPMNQCNPYIGLDPSVFFSPFEREPYDTLHLWNNLRRLSPGV
jgi:hypothetical protein